MVPNDRYSSEKAEESRREENQSCDDNQHIFPVVLQVNIVFCGQNSRCPDAYSYQQANPKELE
jgi:hypothetical protein